MSSADEFDDSELPTPNLPAFVDQGTVGILSALQSFSFGNVAAFDASQQPAYPLSSFPSYCLPRKGSSANPSLGWDLDDLAADDDDDDVNPSPVYGKINADGETIQTPGTPIAERERFDYPDPAASAAASTGMARSSSSDAPPVAIRPSPTPTTAQVNERRGSISLPNVLTSSAAILDAPAPSPSAVLPLQPLHPASSPFAVPGGRRPSLALAQHPSSSSSSSTLGRSRSNSQHRPSFSLDHPSGPGSSRASLSHIHPPTSFFPAMRTDAPIPPSLRNHPALANARPSSSSSAASGGPPPSVFGRRGSLPANSLGQRRNNSLSAYTVPAPPFAGVGKPPPPRRASLSELRQAQEEEEERRRAEAGRPRLGSIPSFGSEDSGSSGGSCAGDATAVDAATTISAAATSGASTPTQATAAR